MSAQHERFETYRTTTATGWKTPGELAAMNARLERERARRYLNRARDSIRLAREAMRRSADHAGRA